ncbi:hypothetical protein L1987_82259 [Smallanthus sonchifolius]|uniref:Uncharacterized protein n=1 Tax=Smallanthus sonchifolius TaxID=185202 RepID=A0ACB8YBP5_9ASTR|nr:hypothetical protein L1987_82259 [Smallanthus sonchifolius]
MKLRWSFGLVVVAVMMALTVLLVVLPLVLPPLPPPPQLLLLVEFENYLILDSSLHEIADLSRVSRTPLIKWQADSPACMIADYACPSSS